MACETRTYELNAAEHMEVLNKLSLESNGLQINPAQGSVTIHGVSISWVTVKDEGVDVAEKVTFTIGAKPWYVSCDQIFGELDKLIGKGGN